jgi:hypothetical protein
VDGKAMATLNMPPFPGGAGVTMYFAYCLNKPYDFASNFVSVQIVP